MPTIPGRPAARAAIATVGALAIAVLAVPRVRVAWRRLRTSSSPSVVLYDVLASVLLDGLYRRIAADVAEVVGPGPADVLEVGPGPGHLAVEMARILPLARVAGLDLDPGMIERARARTERGGVADRVRFVVGDVAAMPLGEAGFDVVISSFSAHHWADPSSALREIRRVLRPGGRAMLYDLPEGWGHFETGAPSLCGAASSVGWRARTTRVPWPGERLSLVRLVDLAVPPAG